MQTFIIILVVIACLLLGLIVLVQNPKGGGLSSSFSSANQIGGVKRTTDFLEKATWSLATVIMALCLISAAFDATTVQTEETQFDDTENMQPQPQGQPGQGAGQQGGQGQQGAPAQQEAPQQNQPGGQPIPEQPAQ